MLDCVFYLYRDVSAAQRGDHAGGTGFWVGVDSKRLPGHYYIFAVSNKHVVADAGASVIRVNMSDGGVGIFEIDPHEWYFDNNDDLAIVFVTVDLEKNRIKVIPASMFVTRNVIEGNDLGPGDEVFMIGRFVRNDGKLTNIPSVRFGSLSMPCGDIEHPSMGVQESFAVEMRSMAGYSGSPVFIYPSAWNMNSGSHVLGGAALYLLGVEWGYIVDKLEVYSPSANSASYVRANTGMNGVVPAWKIQALIDGCPWIPMIDKYEESIIAQEGGSGVSLAAAPVGKEIAPALPDENPQHREDFTSLLNAAAKTRPRGARTSFDENGENSGDS
jgi:hypothetical protein